MSRYDYTSSGSHSLSLLQGSWLHHTIWAISMTKLGLRNVWGRVKVLPKAGAVNMHMCTRVHRYILLRHSYVRANGKKKQEQKWMSFIYIWFTVSTTVIIHNILTFTDMALVPEATLHLNTYDHNILLTSDSLVSPLSGCTGIKVNSHAPTALMT